LSIGYFSVHPDIGNSYIYCGILNKRTVVNKTNFFRHVRLKKPLVVKMDGKKRMAVISVK